MYGHRGHTGIGVTGIVVRSFIIIFLKNIKNNINIKCNNKRPDPLVAWLQVSKDVIMKDLTQCGCVWLCGCVVARGVFK